MFGGDTNQLNVNEPCQSAGWNSLVDFPTRGGAYLDNVLTNRPELFGKCVPFSMSIKTDHMPLILPAGSKLEPVCQKICIQDCRKHRNLETSNRDLGWCLGNKQCGSGCE